MKVMHGILAKGCYFEVFEDPIKDTFDIFLYSNDSKQTTVDTISAIPETEVGTWLLTRVDW